jgi:hypothetical protein
VDTRNDPTRHLDDQAFFALAAPAAGEPEALPEHLSRCSTCARVLADWKTALRNLGEDDLGAIGRRTPEQWREKEDATMAAIRRASRRRGLARPVRWAVGIAASLLLLALALPARRHPAPAAVASSTPAAEDVLPPADRADDALLRDAEFLARGGDTATEFAVEEHL